MRRTRRTGFGLVQLLAVVAVVMLLVGLLLVAIDKVRNASGRVQSQNNMKQIGIAIHSYHDARNNFPAGCDKQDLSFLVQLLPYMEQDNLFKLVDQKVGPEDAANAVVRKTRIKMLESPADPQQEVTAGVAPTSYMGVAGSKPALADNDGFFYRDSNINFGAITDGTSNTIFVVETLKGDGAKQATTVARQHVRLAKGELKNVKDTSGVQEFKDGKNIAGNRGESWMDGRFLQSTITLTRKPNAEEPDVDCGGEGGIAGLRSLGGLVNVGMADGSVRSVNTNVELNIWKALATRAGGEVINDF